MIAAAFLIGAAAIAAASWVEKRYGYPPTLTELWRNR